MPTFTSFDGTEIDYDDVGSGPPVLLLHGFAADRLANWVQPKVVQALVDAGHRVIASDARGHGRSGKPHDPAAYSKLAMPRDAQALLDHLGIGSVHLVGYSMGSIVSTKLAPMDERIRSVVLGGAGVDFAHVDNLKRRHGIADALLTDDPSTITNPAAAGFRVFADATGADKEALAAIQQAEPDPPVDPGAIAVPTLVLTGDGDDLVGSPQELAAKIPGAKVQIVHGDHLSAVGDPAFRQAIVDFVASVPGVEPSTAGGAA